MENRENLKIEDFVFPGFIELEDILLMQKINPYFKLIGWECRKNRYESLKRLKGVLSEEKFRYAWLEDKYIWPGLNDVEFEEYISRVREHWPAHAANIKRFFRARSLGEKWDLDGKIIAMTGGKMFRD